jgi:quercetin dioxygenase-like cupin family protein
MNHKVGKASAHGYLPVLDGIKRKTLVYANETLLTEFRLSKNKILPHHKHPEEQTGYLVSGHMILIIEGERYEVLPGDSWVIPGDVEHGAETLKDSVALEVFSPPREDYKNYE